MDNYGSTLAKATTANQRQDRDSSNQRRDRDSYYDDDIYVDEEQPVTSKRGGGSYKYKLNDAGG